LGVILDTNVLIVADGRTPQAPASCVVACAEALEAATHDVVWLDTAGEILQEYQNNLNRTYPLGVMATFFVELQSNLGVPERCRSVSLTHNADRVYEEFPEDPALVGFDRSDRKFVAVALACGVNPDVLNAVDSDWWHYRAALAAGGVKLIFVCPDLIDRWQEELAAN